MKNIILYSFVFLFVFSSCKTYYSIDKTNSSFNKIDKKLDDKDSSDIDFIIEPYKAKLSKKMNEVLGYSDGLFKRQPESTLGNWVSDAIASGAKRISGMNIDFAIQNYGGIRIRELAKGGITLGKIYELMPFNNYVVILKADANTVQQLMDRMALYGGWPISSSVRYKIENDKAVNILIKGRKIDKDKIYTIAMPDYIANGGDKCTFLKEAKRVDVDQVLIRDVLIDEVKQTNAKGAHINSKIEGRVTK